eukprot:COSAG01_NODE_8779_length_2661_cov_24.829430_2_plen_162_part_00
MHTHHLLCGVLTQYLSRGRPLVMSTAVLSVGRSARFRSSDRNRGCLLASCVRSQAFLCVIDLRRRLAASQKSDLSRDAGLRGIICRFSCCRQRASWPDLGACSWLARIVRRGAIFGVTWFGMPLDPDTGQLTGSQFAGCDQSAPKGNSLRRNSLAPGQLGS